LDGVIENATGLTLNNYTTLKLKNPTGMTGMFYEVGYNNVFVSNARSMARFGSLILNKGNWNGNQIMTDTAYFNDMVNTSQNLNKSYGYLWWLNGKQSFMVPTSQIVFPGFFCPNAPADMISAIGAGGQFLNIVPSQNMVWLRMGDEPSSSLVPFLLNDQIWTYVNDLTCISSINEENFISEEIQLYPNPANEQITISANKGRLGKMLIYNQLGKAIAEFQCDSNSKLIDLSNYQNCIYFLNFPEKGVTLKFRKGN
jgi:CubicO group peptidase (beta-lactamase class C family)